MEASSKRHATAALFPGKKHGSYFKGCWVEARAGLGFSGMEKSSWEDALRACVPPKFLELNLKAFNLAYEGWSIWYVTLARK